MGYLIPNKHKKPMKLYMMNILSPMYGPGAYKEQGRCNKNISVIYR